MSEQAELLLDAPESTETPETLSRVTGFEFLVREPTATRWVQLQGHGGTLGAGLLFLFDLQEAVTDAEVKRMHRELLATARYRLGTIGLSEYRDVADYRERIRPIEVLEVLDVRGPAAALHSEEQDDA